MMKKTAIGIIVLSAAAVSLAVAALNPLRGSPQKIRISLLEAAPQGCSVDTLLLLAKNRGWRAEERRTGFVRDTDIKNVVGVSSVHLSLGEYHQIPIPLVTSVEAFCGFDAAGKLVDVWGVGRGHVVNRDRRLVGGLETRTFTRMLSRFTT